MRSIIVPAGRDGWISSIVAREVAGCGLSHPDLLDHCDWLAGINGLPDRDHVQAGFRLIVPKDLPALESAFKKGRVMPQLEPDTFDEVAFTRSRAPGREPIKVIGPKGTTLTSGYGSRGALKSNAGKTIPPGVHPGLDFANFGSFSDPKFFGPGWALPAPVTGSVAFASNMQGFGLTVIIKLDTPIPVGGGKSIKFLLTAHHDKLLVRAGDEVIQGETPLATIGQTGMSTANHLHLQAITAEAWNKAYTVGGKTVYGLNMTVDPAPWTGLEIVEIVDAEEIEAAAEPSAAA